MSFWTDARVRAALGLPAEPSAALDYAAVATDTRTLPAGALFVALRGEHFDAHEFLAQAVEAGAAAAVVEWVPEGAPEVPYYEVADTLEALGRLARYYRRHLSARVLAITGSNGKTTTKELTRAVLSTRYRVHATTGNLNNLVGAPLTVLAAPADTEVLVVELGTNAPGEVARLAAVVEADAAIVTSIAEEHLEGLGDLEGVLREETSILATLPASGFAAVGDEPRMLPEAARAMARRVRVAGWSGVADAELRAEDVRIDEEGRVRFRWQGRDVTLGIPARHNARNALLALGVGMEWGVEPDAAVAALEGVRAGRMRGELHRYGELMVLSDCYNANPGSLRAAVDTLTSLPRRGGRVAVLGSMLELGPGAAALHREAAEAVAAADVDLIVATGDFVAAFEPLAARLGGRLIRAADAPSAFGPLAERLRGDEVVLLKGSRGVALERLLPLLESRWGTPGPAGDAAGPGQHEHPSRGRDAAPPSGRSSAQSSWAESSRRGGAAAPGTGE